MGAKHESLAAEIIHHNSGVGVIDVVIDGRRAAFSGSAVIADEMRCILAIALARMEGETLIRAADVAKVCAKELRAEADACVKAESYDKAANALRASTEAYEIGMRILHLE